MENFNVGNLGSSNIILHCNYDSKAQFKIKLLITSASVFEQIPANLYLLFFQQSLSTYDGSSKSREPLFSPFTFFFSTFEEEQRPDTAIVSHTEHHNYCILSWLCVHTGVLAVLTTLLLLHHPVLLDSNVLYDLFRFS